MSHGLRIVQFIDSSHSTSPNPHHFTVNQSDTPGRTWENTIRQIYGEKVRKVTRYAIKKEPGVWDLNGLRAAVAALTPEYELRLIDEELYYECREKEWSRDLVAQFSDYGQYIRRAPQT